MSITIFIVIITALVSYQAFSQHHVLGKLLFNPYTISRNLSKEWIRFVASGFIHADWPHLIINMLVLYSFGQALEMYYSLIFGAAAKTLYILLYLTAIPAACVSSYFKNKNNAHYSALGASGAVSAVTFACIVFNPWGEILLFAALPIPGFIYAILYLAYSSYMGKKGSDNIGHEAHFWGAIYGMVFTFLLSPGMFPVFIKALLRM